jgi:hypothetical protein
MKILALEKGLPGVIMAAYQPLLEDEARRVWELQQSGAIREIYFNSIQHTAVLMLECTNVEEAQQLVATLPLVIAGSIEFELIPLVPYDGLARLFAEVT